MRLVNSGRCQCARPGGNLRKHRHPVQKALHVLARDAVVSGDIQALMAGSTRTSNVLDGHACICLLAETDDLRIGESRLLHVRHSPAVDGLSAIQLVRPEGGAGQW